MADLSGLVHPWAPVFYGSYGAYECPHCLRSVEWPMDGLCPDLVSKRLDTLAAQAEERAVGVQEWRRRLLSWVPPVSLVSQRDSFAGKRNGSFNAPAFY